MFERCRMESELAQLEVVNDPDGRARVGIDRTLALPYRWVCRLRTPSADPSDPRVGAGTGVLIGPRHVLTAAHVLVSEKDPGRTVGDRLRVQVARNGHDHPFEPVRVRAWRVDPRWIERVRGRWVAHARFDLALVVLAREVSGWRERRLGACPLAFWGAPDRCAGGSTVGLPAGPTAGQRVEVAGYPGDKAAETLWTATGSLSVIRDTLFHTADTMPGQSGAPVWLMRDGRPCLVGIHSRAGALASADGVRSRHVNNAAVPLTPDRVQMIAAWQRTLGR